MERERKAGLDRVVVTKPGVMRGMDAMYLQTAHGRAYALFTADAAIPYRTGVTVTSRYDANAVVKALQRDIEAHGAPLAYRFDRAKAHQAPQVRTLLEAHGVLALHGPPHCARFYGQHERLNREHRTWLGDTRSMSMSELEACLESMLRSLNAA